MIDDMYIDRIFPFFLYISIDGHNMDELFFSFGYNVVTFSLELSYSLAGLPW